MQGAVARFHDATQTLEKEYRAALGRALDGIDEALLERAYELGRSALGINLGIIDLAHIHHEALTKVLVARGAGQVPDGVLDAAARFFMESLSPFEMSHRGFGETTEALRHLNQVLEDEARRVARALHDDAAQLLVSVYLELETVARDLGPVAVGRFDTLRELLGGIQEQLRRLSHEIRPPVLDDLGLAPALEFLAEGVAARAHLEVRIASHLEGRLPPNVEIALYRIVQEALNNVVRHARASRATVELARTPGEVTCTVADNGVGFETTTLVQSGLDRGIGLLSIRERLQALSGTFTIRSSAGGGTELRVTIPLEERP
ncbi:MAG: ATP-binding protein [Myxococcales bacterium]|nr:ATP-binding protein [Myxococcales bacterium]